MRHRLAKRSVFCAAEQSKKQIVREPLKERREIERSEWVNTQLVLLVFQMECDAGTQRALNMEDYQTAQDFRDKRSLVDEAAERMRKQQAVETTGSMDSVADVATEGLRLRTEMQRAVEEERYADAAKYRDLLAEIEKQSQQAQAAAAQLAAAAQPVLKLGQRVLHKDLGYRGVVAGWDTSCCEEDEWKATVRKVLRTEKGFGQPYYHVLVDVRDFDFNPDQPPITYVAEEYLTCPDVDEEISTHPAFGNDMPRHPFLYQLFLGPDAQGDLVPCRYLREKFSVERRDVYPKEKTEGDGEGGPAAGGDSPDPDNPSDKAGSL